jgi:hypothetical protein
MFTVDTRLSDLLEPVRDEAVGELLQALAGALGRGDDVATEPVKRDTARRVVREGPLALPRRGDLAVTANGRTINRRVETPYMLEFAPLSVTLDNGFSAEVNPFHWEAAVVTVETGQRTPNWTPVRLWFLEYFQPRFGDLAPDLEGTLHAMTGPERVPAGLRFTVDFGSAPVAAFGAMVAAFSETGCSRIRIGSAT